MNIPSLSIRNVTKIAQQKFVVVLQERQQTIHEAVGEEATEIEAFVDAVMKTVDRAP